MTIYADIDYKMEIKGSGNVKIVEDNDAIIQSVKTILSTVPGERIMNPVFGSNLKYILFEPMDEISEGWVKDEIIESISLWEDRIVIKDVIIESLYELNIYSIRIEYIIKETSKYSEFSIGLKAK